jgi:hypothetical protein
VLAWIGCVAGALDEHAYRDKLAKAGFTGIDIEPTRIYRMAGRCGASPYWSARGGLPPSQGLRRRERKIGGSTAITARFEPPTTYPDTHPLAAATVLQELAPRCRPCRRKSRRWYRNTSSHPSTACPSRSH